MYRIGRRLRIWDASFGGATVGILPFVHLISNPRKWIPGNSVW